MQSPDSRFTLTYNGEIYNFREIRDELISVGAQFSSSGDTAVILEGWKRWGSGLLPKMRGMFALALWDRDEERCYLARDAYGIKPLYLHDSGGTVLFASEIRALLASERIPRRLDALAMRSYLATGSVAEPQTIIDSVRALPPGTFVSVDCRRGSNIVGDPIRFAAPLPISNDEEQRFDPAHLRQVLRDSVQHHFVSDVPVALFLSGGIDSSTVVAIASEVATTRLDTFTITFGEADYSEAEPARIVAKRFGTSHHEIPLTARDLLDSLPGAFAAMDQPSLDGLNTFAVSHAVRQNGIKVVLSGLGGDELFAGYPSFARAATANRLWPLRPAVRAVVGRAAAVSKDSRFQRMKILFDAATPARGAYRASRTLFDDERVRSLTGSTRGEIPSLVADSPEEMMLSLMQQLSLFETTGYMRNTLLRDSDVFSMAHSLELRVPFVDREVAKAAMSIPDSVKLRRGVSKPVLVETMKDILPESLLVRRKQGFTLPFERWMRDQLFDEVSTVLRSPSTSSVGLSPEEVARVWKESLDRRGGMTWSRPWALYTLKRWADQNDVAIADQPAASPPRVSLAGAR
jgi:asparagine synthase (glutamine-hydrolysing)